jgi:hypothetical protein
MFAFTNLSPSLVLSLLLGLVAALVLTSCRTQVTVASRIKRITFGRQRR